MGGYGRWAAAHGTLGVRVVSLSGMEGEGLVGRWGVGVLSTIRLWLVLATVLQGCCSAPMGVSGVRPS